MIQCLIRGFFPKTLLELGRRRWEALARQDRGGADVVWGTHAHALAFRLLRLPDQTRQDPCVTPCARPYQEMPDFHFHAACILLSRRRLLSFNSLILWT